MRLAKHRAVVTWQVLFFLFISFWSICSFAQPNQRLHTSLTIAAPEKPYSVQVGIQIDQIVSIDQKSENFQVVGNLRMEWDVPALAFDAVEYGRDYQVFTPESFAKHVDEEGIFNPTFVIHNQQSRRFVHKSKVVVFKDGHAIYLERFTATLQAPEFNFIRYPFDTQVFFLHVDSVMPANYVEFIPLEDYISIGDNLGEEEWVFNNNWTTIEEVDGITGQPSPRFSFGFSANRHLNYYYLRIFLPLVVIILVSWFTFFLNEFSKRVDMAVANLLVFVAFNFTISNDLPRLGYLTFIDSIMFSAFIFAGLVVLTNVAFKRMEVHGREELARYIDKYTIWIYPLTLIVLVLIFWRVFLVK